MIDELPNMTEGGVQKSLDVLLQPHHQVGRNAIVSKINFIPMYVYHRGVSTKCCRRRRRRRQ